MACSRVIRWSLFLLLLAFPASLAVAETIELVTYYPVSASSGNLHGDTLTIGPAGMPTPAEGWGAFNGGLWVGNGYDPVTNPPAAGVLFQVQGADGAVSNAVFMPGTGAGSQIRVGIGTTNPSQILQVEGTGDQAIELRTDADANGKGNASLRFVNAGSNIMGFTVFRDTDPEGAGLAIEDVSGGVPRVEIARFLRNGDVGIGTAAPTARLDVQGADGAASNAIFMPGTGTGSDMRVGIGTASPGQALDVNGIVQISGNRLYLPFIGRNGDLFWIMSGGGVEGTDNALGFNLGNPSFSPLSGTDPVIWARWPVYVDSRGIQGVSSGFTAANLPLNPKGGNVGIGTASPAYTLDVNGSAQFNSNRIYLPFSDPSDVDFFWFMSGGSVEGTNGALGFDPIRKVVMVGPGWTSSGFSSAAFKKDITPLSPPEITAMLDKIRAMRVFRYRLKSEPESGPLHIGVIAEEAPPEITGGSSQTVDFMNYLGFLAAGVKALDQENRRLQAELGKFREQQKEIEDLKARLNAVTKKPSVPTSSGR